MMFIAFDSHRLDILDMTCIPSKYRKCNQEITDTPQVKRKHISLKTRCASLIIQCGLVPYDDAKLMTDDQILSLTQVDHNILHETGHPDRDRAFNLTHMLIKSHRQKTKLDAKVIAKGKRIRNKWPFYEVSAETGWQPRVQATRKLQSRGFDKTMRKRMDGKVEKR